MKEYSLVFHKDVVLDYNEAFIWYEMKIEGLGERFIDETKSIIEKIQKNPEFFSRKSKKEYREAQLKSFPFLIVYKVYPKKKVIFIASIHHERKQTTNKYRKG